jgi:hypothetical protein
MPQAGKCSQALQAQQVTQLAHANSELWAFGQQLSLSLKKIPQLVRNWT